MMRVHIKVEPASSPCTLVPVIADADVKEEQSSPPSALFPAITDADIKEERSSPPSALLPAMEGIDVKVEPSSPTSTLHPSMMDVDIKVEPSSPLPFMPYPVHADTNHEGPPEAAPGSNSCATSENILDDNNPGTYDVATDRLSEKPQSSPDSSHEFDTGGQCFARKADLEVHQTLHGGEKLHARPISHDMSAEKDSLNRHPLVREKEKPHACPVCGTQFPNKCHLASHQCARTSKMSYACEMCPSKFCTKPSFQRHKQLHERGSEMHHCPECGRTFGKLATLQKHRRWHYMDKPYACPLCPATFPEERRLAKHALTHTGEKPHECPLCERAFSVRFSLDKHLRQVHNTAKAAVVNTENRLEVTVPLLPYVQVDTNDNGPAEAAHGSDSSEVQKDFMDDSKLGTSDGAAESLSEKPITSADTLGEYNTRGQCFARKDTLDIGQTPRTGNKSHNGSSRRKKFAKKEALNKRLSVHTEKKRYACVICGWQFAEKSQLVKHSQVHTVEKPYACETCPSKFWAEASLKRHKQLHARGLEVRHCPVCGRTFKSPKSLQQHQKWHYKDRPYACPQCPAAFTEERHLKRHASTHTDEKRHRCTMCKRAFCSGQALSKHIKKVHNAVKATVANTDSSLEIAVPGDPPTKLPRVQVNTDDNGPAEVALDSDGPETPRAITDDNNLGISEGTTESSSDKPERGVDTSHECDTSGQCSAEKNTFKKWHACLICSRRFAEKSELNVHLSVLTGDKPYACEVCRKKFSRKSQLVEHKRVHTCEMRYACETCPSKFCSKVSLDRHKRLHASGVEMHHCPECGRTFTQLTALRKHLDGHKTEKPYVCHLCPARFTLECRLRSHAVKHTGEKPYKCTFCEKAFAWQPALRKHVRERHNVAKAAVVNAESRSEITVPCDPPKTMPRVQVDTSDKDQDEGALESNGSGTSKDIMDNGNLGGMPT